MNNMEKIHANMQATGGARHPPVQALAFTMKSGERALLYALSSGKIALAHLPPKELGVYSKRVQFVAIRNARIDRSPDCGRKLHR